MHVPHLVALVNTVLTVDEEIQVEKDKDREKCLQCDAHDHDCQGTTCCNESNLSESIIFPIIVDFDISDHVIIGFSCHHHGLNFIKL